MKIAIVQPNLFPYKAYYDLAEKVDKFIFLDDVNYTSKNWMNKTLLKLNSSKYYFRIPLDYNEGDRILAKDVLTKDSKWKNKFLKFVTLQYKRAPNYNQVYPLIEEILSVPAKNLCHTAAYSVYRISDFLNHNTNFTFSSVSHSKVKKSYHEKIYEICKREKASSYYVFARQKGEFDEKKFLNAGIKVSYFTSYDNSYSVIDYLMHCPKADFIKKNS